MKSKVKRRYIILLSLLLLVVTFGIVFFQFTPIGYCMTVQFRDFTEVEHNIYIDNEYSYVTVNENNELIDKDNVPSLINEAKSRVRAFFGELQSDPVFIISDKSDKYSKTGSGIAYTFTLFRVHSYIAISHTHLNVDVIAHEITHAELHYRVTEGKLFQVGNDYGIPVWFNEGLAGINDHREFLSDEAMNRKIEIGFEFFDVTQLSRADFIDVNSFLSQENYLMCTHVVKTWVDVNGIDALLLLIDGVRSGDDFFELYGS